MATMEESWNGLLQLVAEAKDRVGDPAQLAVFTQSLDQQLQRFVFYDDRLPHKQQLVHYTSWDRALAILEDAEGPILRMYNYEQANDPQEGKLWRRAWASIGAKSDWLDEYLPQYEETLLKSGRSTGSTYGCSFSSDVGGVEDNLTFWRLYGKDGRGCSFKVTGRLGHLYRVRYLNEDGTCASDDDHAIDQRIASWLEELMTSSQELVEQTASVDRRGAMAIAAGMRKLLGGYHHLAKSAYFADEREWRMIRVAPDEDDVRYELAGEGVVRRYINGLALKDALVTASSITIGPRVPNGGAARAYVEYLIRKQDMHVPDVLLSQQIYRSDL